MGEPDPPRWLSVVGKDDSPPPVQPDRPTVRAKPRHMAHGFHPYLTQDEAFFLVVWAGPFLFCIAMVSHTGPWVFDYHWHAIWQQIVNTVRGIVVLVLFGLAVLVGNRRRIGHGRKRP